MQTSQNLWAERLLNRGVQVVRGLLPQRSQERTGVVSLPDAYRILPQDTALHIPGFHNEPLTRTLCTAPRECGGWYNDFVARLQAARGRCYLPVCRMADGEFMFALGPQRPDVRLPPWHRALQTGLLWSRKARTLGGFRAQTLGRYHSGRYSRDEWRRAQRDYGALAQRLSQHGILALHLSYGVREFQERFFPALGRWLQAQAIILNADNYVPFYFVYAALTGPHRRALLSGRLLVINSAVGAKKARIVAALHGEGAGVVHWVNISADRSLFDRIHVAQFVGQVDMVLVGAGVGKLNILDQLADLQAPCLDAGFIFELWADPTAAFERPYCQPQDASLAPPAAGSH